ncbi:uncharacterized protein Dwil_GK24787 [Drosophila willistoni]|uniref:Uncharacterized protein n=1 Tax=Drosophila willistoni TaxID=7260 RepID=B4N177_DROWI|nr:uncharacterized protein LOC6644162 [Drosophila willistoni]EDW78017.1 uncharacterized protein Dwil_GK24787 [Drosophila willistoni]
MEFKTLKYTIKWDIYEGQPITDIIDKNFDMVIEFMWDNCFMKSLVYEGLGLYEQEDMKEIYSNYVRHILRNECSVMMLSEDETEIIAVALLEWMTDEWHSWVFLPSSIPKCLFQQLIIMKKDLIDSTKRKLGISSYDALHVHEVAFPDEHYFDEDFLICLFDVFGTVAQHMHMPRVCFIALSSLEQEAAGLAEYDEIGRTIYSIYKVGNVRPFDVLRELDEMYALLFELPVATLPYYEYMPGFESFHEALRAKETKDAKDHDIKEEIEYI